MGYTRRMLLVAVASVSGCVNPLRGTGEDPVLGGIHGFSGMDEYRQLLISISKNGDQQYSEVHTVGPDQGFFITDEDWMLDSGKFKVQAEPLDSSTDPVKVVTNAPLSEQNCAEIYVFYTPSGILDIIHKSANKSRDYHCM